MSRHAELLERAEVEAQRRLPGIGVRQLDALIEPHLALRHRNQDVAVAVDDDRLTMQGSGMLREVHRTVLSDPPGEHCKVAHSAVPLLAEKLGRRDDAGGAWLLRDVDLELAAGERLAVQGPSGAGKTVLLRSLALLDPIESGSISWNGV